MGKYEKDSKDLLAAIGGKKKYFCGYPLCYSDALCAK